MKTENGLFIKRVMPTLLGVALFGGLSALPALAQSDQSRDTEANELTPPIPQSAQTTPQKDQTVPESITGYDIDYPDFVVPMVIEYPTFSGLSTRGDVVLWPSQESIDNGTGYIYLLRGNTLYQENVNTLDVINETTVPTVADNDTDNAPQRIRMHRNLRLHRNLDAQATMTDMGLLPPAMMTTNGDYLYMVRGSTLYEFRKSDLSLVRQSQLPGEAESIKANTNAIPDEDRNGINNDTDRIDTNPIDTDRLDETHPDNIGPGKNQDENRTDENGSDNNSTNDESR